MYDYTVINRDIASIKKHEHGTAAVQVVILFLAILYVLMLVFDKSVRVGNDMAVVSNRHESNARQNAGSYLSEFQPNVIQ